MARYAADFLANRRRATSPAAAAPNSRIIGGAGTGAGDPLLDPLDPLLDGGLHPPLHCHPPFDDQPWLDPQPFELDP
ncbi:hypothetical protein [Sphingomonas adhaesiva]|uniref:hypothetical protein n=1 Tax=Sphingomonas adhaesiva TaxID=28212 RepID=UPI002FFA56AE